MEGRRYTWRELFDLRTRLFQTKEENAKHAERIAQLQSVQDQLLSNRPGSLNGGTGIRHASVQLRQAEAEVKELKEAKNEGLHKQKQLLYDLKSVTDITIKVKSDRDKLREFIHELEAQVESIKSSIRDAVEDNKMAMESKEIIRMRTEEQKGIVTRLTGELNKEKRRQETLTHRQNELKSRQETLEQQQLARGYEITRLQEQIRETRKKVQEARRTRQLKTRELNTKVEELNRLNVRITRMKR